MKKLIFCSLLVSFNLRFVTAQLGIINTCAGIDYEGFSGDGGPATSAELYIPSGLATDKWNNCYIADWASGRIREIDATTGIINTVAGGGSMGDHVPATETGLIYPAGVAVDDSGNIYIAEEGNNAIREVTASTGIINTVAGRLGGLNQGYSGDGGPATSAFLDSPQDVALDDSGNIYIADVLNNVIRKVTVSTGIIKTVAGNGFGYYNSHTQYGGYTGDGGPATSAELYSPMDVTLDDSSNLYITDWYNNVIRKVTTYTGIITTIAGNGYKAGQPGGGYTGDGGQATLAELMKPPKITLDVIGNLYITQGGFSVVRKISKSSGIITTVVGNGVNGYTGNGGPAIDAEIDTPEGIKFDNLGNLFISDEDNFVIRKVINITGINNLEKKSSIKVYPNPTKGVITFELNKLLNGFIDLFDIKGGLVLHKQISNSVESIDCSGLTDSVYLYKVTDEKGNIAGEGKVVIEK